MAPQKLIKFGVTIMKSQESIILEGCDKEIYFVTVIYFIFLTKT